MLSFNFKSKKIPSKAYFKKYTVSPNIKNINVTEDPNYPISQDKLCQLVQIQKKYSCNIYEAFRNLGLTQPKDKNGTVIDVLKASGLIELESLRIVKLVDSLNYDLDDHTVVLNYLYPEIVDRISDRASAINYIIERASDYIKKDFIRGEVVDIHKLYCQTSKFRNPLKGYRKGYSIGVNNKCNVQEIYKDPHSKYLHTKVCYDKRIRTIINKDGVRDNTYNSNYKQYLKKKIGDCNQVKNRNPNFYKNNSVSSSSRLARLKYDTLSRTSKSCCGDYKAVPQKDVLGIVNSSIKPCKTPDPSTGQCYMMINGRKRKAR
tara:strand:- start:1125 stop:2078 length:954 start_codon:yes stop_codon:yes gene_type:complete